MIAFDVYVNKVKVCTAGLDELELVVSSLTSTRTMDGLRDDRKITFNVCGMDKSKPYKWASRDLDIGDAVEIRIVDSYDTDRPTIVACSGGSCGA